MNGTAHSPHPRHRTRVCAAALGAALTVLVALSSCADFSSEPAAESVQPSLSAVGMVPQEEDPPSQTSSTPSLPSGSQPSVSGSTGPQDPCHPSDTTIIAACLDAPWGLAVLPDGQSALVGERTTGRILQVAPQTDPVPVAQIADFDATGDGGLLGLALSPHYDEDGLIYAYVTTATDNRILRIARGDTPKAIFTGIPRGTSHNGGRISFGADGYLYVATGDTGDPTAAAAAGSLAGKVLRLDEFGKPAPDSADPSATTGSAGSTGSVQSPTATTLAPSVDTSTADTSTADHSTADHSTTDHSTTDTSTTASTSTGQQTAPIDPAGAIYATGLANPSGMCTLNDGQVAVMDRDGAADVLIPVTAGADLTTAPRLWSYALIDGGGVDCAENSTSLAATSLDAKLVTSLTLGPTGAFTGQPEKLVEGVYGRLLTVEAGTSGLLWATTANKDGHGDPKPRDDMVVVIPGGGSGGGDGRD